MHMCWVVAEYVRVFMEARLVDFRMSLNSAMEREGERREKNPFERLVTDKGGRGSPLSGDQPRTQRLFMTTLLNPVIIRLPWIKKDNIIIKPIINTLIINSYNLTISTKITPILSEMKKLTVTPFTILIKRARKHQKPLIVFKILLKNITKVLYPKIIKTPVEIRKLLPAQYYNHLPFFKGDIAAELPPHRLSIDHIFTLEKNKNK